MIADPMVKEKTNEIPTSQAVQDIDLSEIEFALSTLSESLDAESTAGFTSKCSANTCNPMC